MFKRKTTDARTRDAAPQGRPDAEKISGVHFVNRSKMTPPFPEGMEVVAFGMGCFWGAERVFWQLPGVFTTAAGYQGGLTENPTYEQVCSGRTGHAEVALVVYDPKVVSLDTIMKSFWEEHDPTQQDRQGNDVGTQYRSAVYWTNEAQREVIIASRDAYDRDLRAAGYRGVATEIVEAGPFFYAEEYHQQYLEKNPGGYCNHGFCQIEYTAPAL
jgi:peptide-methionine (S)-S-oxide reductase